jgi:hypothetical protein
MARLWLAAAAEQGVHGHSLIVCQFHRVPSWEQRRSPYAETASSIGAFSVLLTSNAPRPLMTFTARHGMLLLRGSREGIRCVCGGCS